MKAEISRRSLMKTSAQVVNEPVASDHRPLVIVLEQK